MGITRVVISESQQVPQQPFPPVLLAVAREGSPAPLISPRICSQMPAIWSESELTKEFTNQTSAEAPRQRQSSSNSTSLRSSWSSCWHRDAKSSARTTYQGQEIPPLLSSLAPHCRKDLNMVSSPTCPAEHVHTTSLPVAYGLPTWLQILWIPSILTNQSPRTCTPALSLETPP